MRPPAFRAAAMLAAVAVPALSSVAGAQPQSCPVPLADARRLVLVTAKSINEPAAEMQLYKRASPTEPWQALGPSEPVTVGRGGIGWSHFFRRYARAGEMDERRLRELIERNGFEVSNFSYRLDGEGRILRNRMVIRSTDRSAAGRLAQALEKTPAILEFQIAPTGD